MINDENLNCQLKLNQVSYRFLPISKSVRTGLEPEPKISDFEKIKEIGSGSFGIVILARHKQTNIEYALKIIDKRNKGNIEGKPYFRREIEIMYKLHHINCVRLFGHFEDEQNCYFVMEYLPNGNLYSYLKKNKSIESHQVASFMKDLISAVYYLHNMSPPIIHRDIKPENILLSENEIVKLTDFGWSNYIEFSGEERTTFCGTPLYLAPEMLMGIGHDYNVDIWCIGILMFELLVGNPPFIGKDRPTLMNNIIRGKIAWPKYMDEDGRNLIDSILKKDPKMRPSLQEIINHKFFKRYYKDPNEFLVKGNDNLNERPFIISKDKPNIKSFEVKRKNERFKRREVINRNISPLPLKRPELDKSKGNILNNNINVKTGSKFDLDNSEDYYTNKTNKDSSVLQIELTSLKKDYENLFSTLSVIQKENSKNMEQIEKNKTYISKLEKDNEKKKREIQKKDYEIKQLKERNIKQEALILNLRYTIESLKKELNHLTLSIKEKSIQRPRTPDNIFFRKKYINPNQPLNTLNKNFLVKNETLRDLNSKNNNNKLMFSSSSSRFYQLGRVNTEDSIEDKKKIKKRRELELKYND